MLISACGLICNECPFFEKDCKGCFAVEGKTFWAADAMPNGTCSLFDCSVNTRKYKNCGACAELPCKMFTDLKDPNSSEEEHQKTLIERVKRLKQNEN